mmetsp:Transcript_23132/g.53493  ORF Transcript_23132/g.53493 Transcript_23132/m.53493 type:complete len:80 (+) Transcript_23132:286-525(+)
MRERSAGERAKLLKQGLVVVGASGFCAELVAVGARSCCRCCMVCCCRSNRCTSQHTTQSKAQAGKREVLRTELLKQGLP